MTTADELLANVLEVDKTLVIDNDFRTIKIPTTVPNLGVEHDDEVLSLQFKMPLYVSDTDLSTFAIRVNYINAKGESDAYTVEDPIIDNDHIMFTWLVGPTATRYKGDTKFNVCAVTLKDSDTEVDENGEPLKVIDREFNTTIASLPVLEGLEVDESIVSEYSDLLEQWRQALFISGGGGGGTIDLSDYVKKTDIATGSTAGVVKIVPSLGIQMIGENISIVRAEKAVIDAKNNGYYPITPLFLDYAVKTGLTTNTITLTEDEKAAAQNWLGLGSIETAPDAVLYTEQTLTPEQQAQARANIGVDASGTTVDGTLTQHGVAADAGSVGDMLHAELSYSVTDSVKAGSDYKGYYNGKRVDVFIPAYTDFDIIVETDAFDTSILYCYQNETTNMAFSTDFPSNTRRTYNTYYDITGITLYAKSADITQSGDFTIKVTLKNKDGIEYRLANAELGISKSDILNLNPQDEMLPLFQHAKGSTEEGGNYGANRPKCLVLAHFSDIHGDGENLNRIVRFTDTYKDYIDDVVCTGDIARDNASSNGVEEDFSWWSNNGGENVLMTIGNHDTNVVVGTTSNWRDYGKVNTYNKYFAPFIDNWGVTQPSDAASGGKCYYYKDYPAYNIRVIALDCMYYDADHDAWFVDVLADARTKGYAVITMAHALGDSGENIECTYSAINTTAGPALLDSGEYIFCANVHSRIDDFIAAGGTFICFLGGHYHRDLFGLVKGTDNKQLYSLAACAGSYAPGRDFDGTIGTRSQDCFNIVAVDPTLKLVKLFKVGCQYDNYMRQKGTLCYNYETHKLVYNGGGSSSDVGDIDAALNAIIAIQNNLIGGDGA